MRTWLLVDAQYLCHRARYVVGHLSHRNVATGVAFGVIRDVENQIEFHGADRVVFAFDHPGPSLRKQILPTYKSSRRKDLTDEEKADLVVFYEQLNRLKTSLLPSIGYRNIVEVEGYEADDIIAQISRDLPVGDDAVIVSADKDLYQCVCSNVRFHNPTSKETVTPESFFKRWYIPPEQWSHVKALSGCSGDDVLGIRGIGEKSAAGWFSGSLAKGKKWDLINDNIDVLARNLPLVKLPFPGLVLPELVDDELTESKKIAVQTELGIRVRRGGKKIKESVFVGGFDL